MTWTHLLGLPLNEALRILQAAGINPSVEISRAPRRPEGAGAFRVVRLQEEGRRLTACAFAEGPPQDPSGEGA